MTDNDEQLTKLKTLLDDQRVNYAIINDEFSIEKAADGAKHYGILLQETTPTLILKAKDKYYAAIICGDTRIVFKKLKQALGVKDLTMADPETVLRLTGAKVGEVCLINDSLPTLIDSSVLKNENCYGGCGVARATLRISSVDLVRVTRGVVLDFAEVR
jgi:prolyl-tRNA editing enzyme YbaK/EbsC (Cys-tRNA(Pro) deacylase)